MTIATSKILQPFQTHPKKVFLLDGIGAFISAIFLGFLLVILQPYIGMPVAILRLLGFMAFCYMVYSFSCYFFLKGNWTLFLRIIAAANLFHVSFTVYLMYQNFDSLTTLGILYFVVEIIIVIWVALFELKIAAQINHHN